MEEKSKKKVPIKKKLEVSLEIRRLIFVLCNRGDDDMSLNAADDAIAKYQRGLELLDNQKNK